MTEIISDEALEDVRKFAQQQPILGVATEDPLLKNTEVIPTDIELAERLTPILDLIEDVIPRLALAIARKRFPREESRIVSIRHATQNAHNALRVLREDVEALTYSDEARAARRAQEEMDHIWRRAKSKYQHWAGAKRKGQDRILPFEQLSEDQKSEWFGLADDRVPRVWDELSPGQREAYAARHHMSTDPGRAKRDHTMRRARGLRRRAYKQVEHSRPYTVLSPTQRMDDIAAAAQTLSWARAQRARGAATDLDLAVMEEHYRRALHAYTRPTEPYPEAP